MNALSSSLIGISFFAALNSSHSQSQSPQGPSRPLESSIQFKFDASGITTPTTRPIQLKEEPAREYFRIIGKDLIKHPTTGGGGNGTGSGGNGGGKRTLFFLSDY